MENINITIQNKKIKRDRNKILMTILMVIGIVLFIELTFLTYMLGTYKYIYKGVWVEGINLEGMTRKQAAAVLEKELTQKNQDKTITFEYKNYQKEISLSEIISNLDYQKIAMKAKQIGREGNLFERFYQVIRLRKEKINIEPSYVVNITELRKQIYGIKQDIDKEFKEAKIIKNPEEDFKVENEEVGRNVLIDETIEEVKKYIESGKFDTNIEIVVQEELPTITSNYIENFKDKIGSGKTNIDNIPKEYLPVIKKNISKLSGVIINVDEEFVFSENLDLYASTLENNRSSEENCMLNCLLATTLYNALLDAEINVSETENHLNVINFLPLAFDVHIEKGKSDLKFKNNLTFPIYIEAYIKNDSIYVNLYGKKEYKKYEKVELIANVLENIPMLDDDISYDENVEPGEKILEIQGKEGFKVEALLKGHRKDGKTEEKKQKVVTYKPTANHIKVSVTPY